MDIETLTQYEAAIFSMAHGMDYESMIGLMEYFAEIEEYEAAEGVRLAIADHEWNVGKQNCRVIPMIADDLDYLDSMEEDRGYTDGSYEGIEDEDDEDE